MPNLVDEIREHLGHQWSNREFVQSEKVRDIMRRAADEIERLRVAFMILDASNLNGTGPFDAHRIVDAALCGGAIPGRVLAPVDR